jgi:hypothetical protein
MKKLLVIGLGLSLLFFYALPAIACDCDTAAALQLGLKDRLHQPWPGDPEHSVGKTKSTDNGPKQEMQPTNVYQGAKQQGEIKK